MYAYPFLSLVQTFGLLNAHFLVRLYFTINSGTNLYKNILLPFFLYGNIKS